MEGVDSFRHGKTDSVSTRGSRICGQDSVRIVGGPERVEIAWTELKIG